MVPETACRIEVGGFQRPSVAYPRLQGYWGNQAVPEIWKLGPKVIGVARVFSLGGGTNVKPMSTYTRQKLKIHRIWSTIFWEEPKFTIKK